MNHLHVDVDLQSIRQPSAVSASSLCSIVFPVHSPWMLHFGLVSTQLIWLLLQSGHISKSKEKQFLKRWQEFPCDENVNQLHTGFDLHSSTHSVWLDTFKKRLEFYFMLMLVKLIDNIGNLVKHVCTIKRFKHY